MKHVSQVLSEVDLLADLLLPHWSALTDAVRSPALLHVQAQWRTLKEHRKLADQLKNTPFVLTGCCAAAPLRACCTLYSWFTLSMTTGCCNYQLLLEPVQKKNTAAGRFWHDPRHFHELDVTFMSCLSCVQMEASASSPRSCTIRRTGFWHKYSQASRSSRQACLPRQPG